tara:strand:- start:82371 stop:82496 length:126 start_codon:yes stop_codon:yes gene_type:complete
MKLFPILTGLVVLGLIAGFIIVGSLDVKVLQSETVHKIAVE